MTHLKKYPEAKQTAEYHQALDILWKQHHKVSRKIEHHIEEKRSIPAPIPEPHPYAKWLQKTSATNIVKGKPQGLTRGFSFFIS